MWKEKIMKDGFIKIACATPELRVADCEYNAEKIIDLIKESYSKKVNVVCFPELSVTGYTCGDLFMQSTLGRSAEKNLIKIADETAEMDIISIVGLPFSFMNKLYNCAAVIHKGKILGIVPKKNVPNYSEFYEMRYFSEGFESDYTTTVNGQEVEIGTNLYFECSGYSEFSFGVEICEDLWAGDTPSVKLAQSGASIIFNLSASDEIIGKSDYRRTLIKAKSGSTASIYAYADAGIGESTTDMVFAGHNIIAENGSIIAESDLFGHGLTIADVDVNKICSERRKTTTWRYIEHDYHVAFFDMEETETPLSRNFHRLPFVPSVREELDDRCSEILTILAVGLMSRLKHIGSESAVLGLSGGLDSALAIIVTVRAFRMLGLDTKGITAVTMPCFGTTGRTYNNACELAKAYGTTLREIDIKESVIRHFLDIGHDKDSHNITYENSQARERTQILMDIANQTNGIVIGTGDLSELALGWATYNGDHMSMYAVNASVPKTLVRHLVGFEASSVEDKVLKKVLMDILDTPVSPELLPPSENGTISQKTEDLVGPYELHDFFLYYMIRFGFSPSKIFRMANIAFKDIYSRETILKWEKTFYKRFFSQQFKRSCLPDGPKVGSVTLSPRGDFRMPSDASSRIWLDELDKLS